MRRILLSLVAMLCVTIGMMADEYTVTQSVFSTITGNVGGDANITYTAAKGGASTAPGVYSNAIRIYQNGGTLTVTANNGSKIKSIILGSSTNTSVIYALGTGSASEEQMLAASAKITVDAKDSTSVLFTCKGRDKNTRLNVNYLSVTYDDGKVAKVAKPTFTPAAGSYYGAQKVTIACETEGASIKYSTDGTNYSDYTEPVTVSATGTLYAKGVKDADESSVATAAYTINPIYASLAELVASGAPTTTGALVQLTLTNEKIQSIAMNAAGTSRLGVYVKSGDQQVELYLSGVPAAWVENGTISGTVQGTYKLFNNSVWEVVLSTGAWSSFTYADPVYAFTATENIGTTKAPVYKEIVNKFTKSPLTVMYNEDATGLTFKVNGTTKAYDATTGLSLAHTAMKNEKDTVQVYNGETLVAEQIFTWIPSTNVTNYKKLEDGTEAVLTFASGNKVTYVGTTDIYFEDASQAIDGYNLGLATTPTAYTTIKSGSVWGIKKTYSNVVEICKADSTATCSTIEQNTTAATPTALTVDKAYGDATQQLRYAKISGCKIKKSGTQYTAVGDTCTATVYDKYSTKALAADTLALCYADLTCIVGVTSKGAVQFWPIALENINDSIKGTCGTVDWAIDLDGNMVFTPTDGVSGTLAALGINATKRPWSANVTAVKTVKFDAGVATAADPSYMFKDMTNLESVDFTNLNTSAATTMKGLFTNCSSIKSIDMSVLDLAKVTSFQQTFDADSALVNVTFGANAAAAATSFSKTFYNCKALETADLNAVTGAAVTDVTSMFYNCVALKKVDLRAFSTAAIAKATKMASFFGAAAYSALPETLILSKNFGKISTGEYIALPGLYYMAVDNAGAPVEDQKFNLVNDTEGTAQAALYAYNEGLESYGTYVPYALVSTLAVGETGYATYYNSTTAYYMPKGMTGYTVKVSGKEVVLTPAYAENTIVPAGEPLVLSAAQGDYNILAATTTASKSADNALLGTDEETALEADANAHFYGLSTDKATGTAVGFYWMNETGAAFTNGAHKAYLKVANGGEVRSFIFGDTTTGIKSVDMASKANKIYDITGRQVNATKAGLYIVDGVKMYIK